MSQAMQRISMVRETIKALKQAIVDEADPRQRADYADTLDRLELSLEYELECLDRSLAEQAQREAARRRAA